MVEALHFHCDMDILVSRYFGIAEPKYQITLNLPT